MNGVHWGRPSRPAEVRMVRELPSLIGSLLVKVDARVASSKLTHPDVLAYALEAMSMAEGKMIS